MPEHSPLEDFLAGVGQRFKNAQAGHSKRLKGRSLQEIFESGPGAGFGAGTVGSVRGLAPGLGITLGGRQVTKGGLGQIDKTAITSKKSNLNRSASISEEGFRRNVGGKRPPDAELEALALRKQGQLQANKRAKKTQKDALLERTKELETNPRSTILRQKLERVFDEIDSNVRNKANKIETRISEVDNELNGLKRRGFDAKTSTKVVSLQKELRSLINRAEDLKE